MSPLRIVQPVTKDLLSSRSRSVFQRCALVLGTPNSCFKRPFSGNPRQTSVSLLRSASTSMPVHSKNMSDNTESKISSRCVTYENMNPAIKVMEYAVRGPLVIRASEIEKELEKVKFKNLGYDN